MIVHLFVVACGRRAEAAVLRGLVDLDESKLTLVEAGGVALRRGGIYVVQDKAFVVGPESRACAHSAHPDTHQSCYGSNVGRSCGLVVALAEQCLDVHLGEEEANTGTAKTGTAKPPFRLVLLPSCRCIRTAYMLCRHHGPSQQHSPACE